MSPCERTHNFLNVETSDLEPGDVAHPLGSSGVRRSAFRETPFPATSANAVANAVKRKPLVRYVQQPSRLRTHWPRRHHRPHRPPRERTRAERGRKRDMDRAHRYQNATGGECRPACSRQREAIRRGGRPGTRPRPSRACGPCRRTLRRPLRRTNVRMPCTGGPRRARRKDRGRCGRRPRVSGRASGGPPFAGRGL
jgi:hypothetical protein